MFSTYANICPLHMSNDTHKNINTLRDVFGASNACKNIIAIIISSSQKDVDRTKCSLAFLINFIGDKWREDF